MDINVDIEFIFELNSVSEVKNWQFVFAGQRIASAVEHAVDRSDRVVSEQRIEPVETFENVRQRKRV